MSQQTRLNGQLFRFRLSIKHFSIGTQYLQASPERTQNKRIAAVATIDPMFARDD